MRHFSLDFPDLSPYGFRRALGKNRPATLEKGGGSAPQAPNPQSTAGAVTQINNSAAAFNKALNLGNYSGPFGSQSSSISGYDPATGAPIYQTNISANPQLQGAMNGLFGQIGNSAGINQQALDGIGDLNKYLSNIGYQSQGIAGQYGNLAGQLNPSIAAQAQQQGQDAAYKAQTQYLDPQFSQQKESLDAQLANQGLTPGSEAYNNAMLNYNNQKQQAYSNAQNQSILTGSQIGTQNLQNQIAGMNAQGNMLQGQLGALSSDMSSINQRAGMYGQQVGIGQTPYSNLQSIAGMIPGYSGTANAGTSPADLGSYLNNQYMGQLGQYNARQQSNNAMLSSLGSLATSAMFGGGGSGGLFSGLGGGSNFLSGAGSALSGLSPSAAGSLGDALGMSFGGTYGAGTQAGLDGLISSLGGGAASTAGAGTAGAAGTGAAAGGAAEGSAAAGAGAAGSAGLAAATALPFGIALLGMTGALDDNGTPYTQANDAWASALTKDPSLINIYGQGDVTGMMAKLGIPQTEAGFNQAKQMLASEYGGGSFFSGFLGGAEQGMGG